MANEYDPYLDEEDYEKELLANPGELNDFDTIKSRQDALIAAGGQDPLEVGNLRETSDLDVESREERAVDTGLSAESPEIAKLIAEQEARFAKNVEEPKPRELTAADAPDIPVPDVAIPSAAPSTPADKRSRLEAMRDQYMEMINKKAPDQSKELAAAKKKRSFDEAMAELGQAGMGFAAAGGMDPNIAKNTIYQGRLKRAGREVEEIQKKIKSSKGDLQKKLEQHRKLMGMERDIIAEKRAEMKDARDTEAYKFKLDALKEEKALNDRKRDPLSDESERARATAKWMGADIPDLDKMSASQIEEDYPKVKDKLDRDWKIKQAQIAAQKAAAVKAESARKHQASLDERIRKREDTMSERKKNRLKRQNDAYVNYAKTLQKDKRFDALQKNEMAFKKVNNLIDMAVGGNQAAMPALGATIARAMGEVGVLTEEDVKRYLGNTTYARKFMAWKHAGFDGDMPKPQGDDLKKVASLFRQVSDKDLQGIYDEYARGMMSNYKGEISFEEAQQRMGNPLYVSSEQQDEINKTKAKYGLKSDTKSTEKKSSEPTRQLTEAKAWLAKNPTDPRAESVRQKIKMMESK